MPAIELLYQAGLDQPAKKIAVINAVGHRLLSQLCQQAESYTLIQHFKPLWDILRASGLSVMHQFEEPPAGQIEGRYDLIFLLPSKNRQQSHAWMAEAMLALKEGGTLMVACANNHGAKSYENALKGLAAHTRSQSKSKCRVFSACKNETLDLSLAGQWLSEGEESLIESHGLISRPGLFSWDRADRGSLLLLQHLPRVLKGAGMDLCCGYGLLSESLLKTYAGIEKLHMLEADKIALDCAVKNTQVWSDKVQHHWLDASGEPLPLKLDWVVCNPPFHSGQDKDIELGQKIVAFACRSLKRGGNLYLVANRKLPYEDTLGTHLRHCKTLIETGGFKVIQGTR